MRVNDELTVAEESMRLNWSALILAALVLTSGCATGPNRNPADPFEPLNRKMYSFNKGLDTYLLRPAAKGYHWITPDPVETGVSNFFDNLDNLPTSFNGLLQGKWKQAGSDLLRFVVNSTVGIAGFFDVASSWGLDEHDEDFGQTLGYWGLSTGPYFMVPFFGPTTLRDGVGEVGDYPLSYSRYLDDVRWRNSLKALDLIQTRAGLLEFDKQLEEAMDEYTFVREAYLQNRQFRVYDGNPPQEDDPFAADCDDDTCDDELLEDE